MAGLQVIPSNISKLGLRGESSFGGGAVIPLRGFLAQNFSAERIVDADPFKKISGIKGQHGLGRSGEHWEVSFIVCAMASGANGAGLGDILGMIYDKDVVTGGGPDFTHTFDVVANIQKKSFALIHDDATALPTGEVYEYQGFVANEVTIVADKAAGIITVEVTGIAQKRVIGVKTLALEALTIWSPVNAKLELAGVQLDMYQTITITHFMGTEPHDTINNAAFPLSVNGVTNDCRITCEGFWSTSGATSSLEIRNFFTAHTEQATNLLVKLGPTVANDEMVLTFPRWGISAEANKAVEPDTPLPQTVTFESVHQGLAANNHKTVLTSLVTGAFPDL